MASTFSNNLRLEKQTAGENDSTWGAKLNTVIDLIEEALTSMETISTTSGTVTLSTSNSVSDQSRKSAIKLTATLVGNLVIEVPAKNKHYLVWNATSGAYTVTVKVTGQTGVAVPQGAKAFVYCDGTDVRETIDLASLGITASAAELNILDGATLTVTELNYVDGVTSAIQTQLDTKLPASGGTDLAVADGGTGASTAANARTNLGLAIGTDVQAQGATLTALEALNFVAGDTVYFSGADTPVRLPKGTASQLLAMNAGATAPEWTTPAASGVTSVSGTAPVVSSGGATPAISIPAATASVAGHMTAAYASKLDGIAAGANLGVALDSGHGNVGSLCFAKYVTADVAAGSTYAGSALYPAGFDWDSTSSVFSTTLGTALTGTWRALGTASGAGNFEAYTLFQRIS